MRVLKSDISENINQAFLLLEFSLKLLTYTELGKIDKNEFDTDVTVIGQDCNLSFNHNSFGTYDDLILAAENNFNITLGFTSIVLNTSLDLIGITCNPRDRSPDGMLRTLIYMIRCAYAHDMMHPRWKVKNDYAQPLEIQLQKETLKLDLSQKDGQLFSTQDIGGSEKYFEIKDLVLKKFF